MYATNPGKFKSVAEIFRTELKRCLRIEDGYSEYEEEESDDVGEIYI